MYKTHVLYLVHKFMQDSLTIYQGINGHILLIIVPFLSISLIFTALLMMYEV